MISYILQGHEYINTVQTGIQIFYPMSRYARVFETAPEGITVISCIEPDRALCRAYENGVLIGEDEIPRAGADPKEDMILLKTAIYNVLTRITGYIPPWGIQTGIRPAKLAGMLFASGMAKEQVVGHFMSKYRVMQKKAELAAQVYEAERKILEKSGKGGYSLYAGIPFCPTRCLYCSFAAYPINVYAGKVNAYLDALEKELRFLGEVSRGHVPDSIYIGGGTPTSLDASGLDRLLTAVNDNFSRPQEFTVEAGRPDTITGEKLDVMKEHNVTRISINPQTMNQKTLDAIGRNHSVADIVNAFALARGKGFDDINMDLILGLPGETEADVLNTLRRIAELGPDSLTVHTLAVKRASRLKEALSEYPLTQSAVIESMIDSARNAAGEMGLSPYYMYRQKNMLGSFENVGYAREGSECLYNVKIMEETQTILAAGAGAVTKTLDASTDRIDRVFNVKNVDEYINRIDEMIERKKDLAL